MSRRTRFATLLPIALVAAAGACSRTQNQPKLPLGQATASSSSPARDALPQAARAALDLGNLEFRAGHFDKALAAYRDARKAAPNDAAPYFGIYMTAQKLGNKTLADSASGEIAARSSGSNVGLSDSAMRALHASGAKAVK